MEICFLQDHLVFFCGELPVGVMEAYVKKPVQLG